MPLTLLRLQPTLIVSSIPLPTRQFSHDFLSLFLVSNPLCHFCLAPNLKSVTVYLYLTACTFRHWVGLYIEYNCTVIVTIISIALGHKLSPTCATYTKLLPSTIITTTQHVLLITLGTKRIGLLFYYCAFSCPLDLPDSS